MFEIPITVVKPEPLTLDAGPRPTFVVGSVPSISSNGHVETMRQVMTYSGQSVVFQPNNIRRHFLMVPDKATWAVVKVRSHESKAVGKFVLHTVQLLPKTIVKGTVRFNTIFIRNKTPSNLIRNKLKSE